MKRAVFLGIIVCLLLMLAGCNGEADLGVRAADSIYEAQRMFFLENATEYERMIRLSSIALHNDGIVEFTAALTSSFALPQGRAVYDDDDDGRYILRVYSDVNENEPIAVFELADDENTLILREAFMPLSADIGARYVYKPQWISFADGKISIYMHNIPYIKVFHMIEGRIYEFAVSFAYYDPFTEWAESLILEKAEPSVIELISSNEGIDVYLFRTSFGGPIFEYGIYYDENSYVFIGGNWYQVKNPSPPPLMKAQ